MSINLIKIVALLCMVIDHIGEFIPQVPVWFRYIGRLAVPLFFYCSAWGFYYTSNRKKYLCRLYFLGIIMAIGNSILYIFVGHGKFINNNIFATILWGCIIVLLLENANNWRKRVQVLGLLTIQQVVSFFLCALFAEFLCIPKCIDTYMLYYDYGALFGSMIFLEGGILFVFFFVMVYFLKEKLLCLSSFMLCFSVFVVWLVRRIYYMRGAVSYLFPFDKFQWMMLFSIPVFFLYNGKKGKNMKWFYYVFYPLHIWLLYGLGCSMVSI